MENPKGVIFNPQSATRPTITFAIYIETRRLIAQIVANNIIYLPRGGKARFEFRSEEVVTPIKNSPQGFISKVWERYRKS